jgi:two-component system phosphate regulon sensor histidine kinase PhoR
VAVIVVVLWLGSLWLAAPEPEIAAPRIDAVEVSRDAVRESIEPIGEPLLILDGGRIVVANAAARSALGAHVIGQDARIVLRHPDAVRLLASPDGTSVTIPGFTGGRSLWQLTRRHVEGERWMIEMHDRTAESDVSRAHTDFVANASHELRTPLAALVWQSRLAREAADTTEQTAALARVEQEALRAGHILQQLLEMASAQRLDVSNAEPVALDALCRDVVAAHAELAHQRRQELSLDAPDEPILVQGHATLLTLVLRNLVDNALRHTPEGSQVWVLLRTEPDGSIALSVDDNGPGHAANAPRDAQGLGIGLTLVERISQRLGLVWQHQPGDTGHPHGHTLRWPAPTLRHP